MEIKPLTTLNLIDKLCGEKVKSPWNIASTSGSHDDDHVQLDAISTALTLHLPCREPQPSTANKRKQRATLVEDYQELKRRKVQDNENDESFLSLTLGLPQFSSTTLENDNKCKLLKRKREEEEDLVAKPDDDESFPRLALGHENVKLKKKKKKNKKSETLKAQEDDKSIILSPSNVDDHMKQKEKESENLVEEDHHHHQEDRELFKIKKRLTQSDVGNLCRLLVNKSLVEAHIDPFFDAETKERVKSEEGLDVIVKDTDVISGDHDEHVLRFKYLESSKSYVFNGSWIRSFVRRKKLKKDDEVGLYWDSLNSKFNFSLLAAAANNQPDQASDRVCSIS